MKKRTRVAAVSGLALAGVAVVAAAWNAGTASSDSSAQRHVLATANIFGAGYGDAPAPSGGGGGTQPPGWRLPVGSARVVTFPSVTGTVSPISGERPYNGPGGDGTAGLGPTDIASWRGISGIVDRKNGMFLVGVFLGKGEPRLPAPDRLDFTGRERFDTLEPALGQTFFIGDGRGRRYAVPDTATRLYLGFADGYFYKGQPGWFGNNAGRLKVIVRVPSR